MHARFVLIATAMLMSGSAFAAEPAKPPVQPNAPSQSSQPPVVLASASDVRATSSDQQSPAPPKRHLVRVTSCRCGDQAADPEVQSQQ